MKKVLIITGRYLPGHKDGGPLRTLVNLTDALGDEYSFYIVCYDRDHGDSTPYNGIKYNEWNMVGRAKVWYVPEGQISKGLILQLSKDKDVIYLTSFFESYGYLTLWLKKNGKIKSPVSVASMGVFSAGALKQKHWKKKTFIFLCKILGLFNNITWSVTSAMESEDVKREIGKNAVCIVAEDLPRTKIPGYKLKKQKTSIAFLSRISPKKNLVYAIRVLKAVKSEIVFNIYGPAEDEVYFSKCMNELKMLPKNIKWFYYGDIASEEVQDRLSENDIFLFPTLGENYGHVIFEALSVGCIPIISDQTPWIEIKDSRAGFVLPLNDMNAFTNAVESVSDMDLCERETMAKKCVQLALNRVEKNKNETGYRMIFG